MDADYSRNLDRDGAPTKAVRPSFARDSALEGDGFEPSVPRQIRSDLGTAGPSPSRLTASRGTGSSNPSPSSGESCANLPWGEGAGRRQRGAPVALGVTGEPLSDAGLPTNLASSWQEAAVLWLPTADRPTSRRRQCWRSSCKNHGIGARAVPSVEVSAPCRLAASNALRRVPAFSDVFDRQ